MAHLRLWCAATIVLVAALAVQVAEAQPLAQRKAFQALTASELLSLRRGVAQMMARDTAPRDSADFRRSWIYWVNTHQYFGNDCPEAGPIPPNLPNLPGMARV